MMMKNLSISLLLLVSLAFISSCKNTDGVGKSITAESYDVSIKGSHPDGEIDSKITVTKNETINTDKITLKGRTGDINLSITINLPADRTVSGKKESIGIVIYDLDGTGNLWEKNETYKTYHFKQSIYHRKRATIDYIIGESNGFYYTSLNNQFISGEVTLTPDGNRLKGSFSVNLVSDFGNGKVQVTGEFDALLNETGTAGNVKIG